MRVDGDAATVVAHSDGVIGVKLHLDPVGMARDGLVHGVVEDLGHHVMQRAVVGAADIHARPLAHGFKPFKDLDRTGIIVVAVGEHVIGHGGCSSFLA